MATLLLLLRVGLLANENLLTAQFTGQVVQSRVELLFALAVFFIGSRVRSIDGVLGLLNDALWRLDNHLYVNLGLLTNLSHHNLTLLLSLLGLNLGWLQKGLLL